MKRSLASRLSAPVFSALVLLLLSLGSSALGAPADQDFFFRDDFSGSTLDASKWETGIATSGVRYANGIWTMPPPGGNYGSVTVANSLLTLANTAPTLSSPMFPLIWSNNAIPASGDFQLELRMRYTGGGRWGDGVRIVAMPSPFDPAPGSTESAEGQFVLMIHQDNEDCRGPNVSLLGHPGEGSATLPFNADWHTYKLRYVRGNATLYIDDHYFDGPLPAPRPNCIQLGVGEVACCGDSCEGAGCRWTSYAVDYIQVQPLATTAAEHSTWGAVKARFRP